MKHHSCVLASLALAVVAPALAEVTFPVERPELAVGDRWTYQVTDGLTKQIIGKKSVQVTNKNARDYSIRAEVEGNAGYVPTALTFDLAWVVSVDGKETDHVSVNFPMVVGKTWDTHELWKNSRGHDGSDDLTYKVVGAETITVPAGTFAVTKVIGDGSWKNVNGYSGKVELVYWYAPAVKAIARSEYKTWLRGQVDLYRLFELTEYKLNKEATAGEK